MKAKNIIFSLALACGLLLSMTAAAETTAPDGGKPDSQNPVKKLARGIVNAVIGIGEIPINIGEVEEKEGPLQAVSYGTLKGVCFFVLREVVGVVDVATFYAPLPGTVENGKRDWGWSYGPLMEPAWVIE